MEAQRVSYQKKWGLSSTANSSLNIDENKTVQSGAEFYQNKKKQNWNDRKVEPQETTKNYHCSIEEKENSHRGWTNSRICIKAQTKVPLKRSV